MMIVHVTAHGSMVWNLYQGVVTATVQDEFGATLDRASQRVTVAVDDLPGLDTLMSEAMEALAQGIAGAARQQREDELRQRASRDET